jgi:transposase
MIMSIRRCKLSKKVQRKLLEYFVLEVTARSAAGSHSQKNATYRHDRRRAQTVWH